MAESTSDISQTVYSNFVQSYCQVAVLTLVIYEYVTTIDREVQYVWRRRPTATSCLLLSIRWVMVLTEIVQFVPLGPRKYVVIKPLCKPLLVVGNTSLALMYVQTALFSALRVYVLWSLSQHRFLLSGLVLAPGLAPLITNIARWATSGMIYVGPPYSACLLYSKLSESANVEYYVTRSCVLLADVLVVMLTWVKTLNQWRESRKLKINVSLTFLFLRDGTLYFLALSACNIASICTSAVRRRGAEAFTSAEIVQAVLAILPSLLIQRFLLNPRQFAQGDVADTTPGEEHFSHFSAPQFGVRSAHSFLGNIGEPLEHVGNGQAPEVCINAAALYQQYAANVPEGSNAALMDSGVPYTERAKQMALHNVPSIDAVEMFDIEEVDV